MPDWQEGGHALSYGCFWRNNQGCSLPEKYVEEYSQPVKLILEFKFLMDVTPPKGCELPKIDKTVKPLSMRNNKSIKLDGGEQGFDLTRMIF